MSERRGRKRSDHFRQRNGEGGGRIVSNASSAPYRTTSGKRGREVGAEAPSACLRTDNATASSHNVSPRRPDYSGPERSINGWVIFVTGLHEEAQDDGKPYANLCW